MTSMETSLPDHIPDNLPDEFDAVFVCNEQPEKHLGTYEENGFKVHIVAYYSEQSQEWTVRRQILHESDWLTSGKAIALEQTGPEDHPIKLKFPYRFIKRGIGGVQNHDPKVLRPVIALTDALQVFWWAITGNEYRLVEFHDEDWSPDQN